MGYSYYIRYKPTQLSSTWHLHLGKAGCIFELVTDHQPLLTMHSPVQGIPVVTAIRRRAICLMGYSYYIRYKPTRLHTNADVLLQTISRSRRLFYGQRDPPDQLLHTETMDECPGDTAELQSALGKHELLRMSYADVCSEIRRWSFRSSCAAVSYTCYFALILEWKR